MSPADANRLIVDATAGVHQLSSEEVAALVEHVARVGFDPDARERVRGELADKTWRGRMLRGSDRLPPAERHYLKHVVLRHEWPSGTSLEDYLRSITDVILDPASGVFTSLYQGVPQLGVIRQSGELRGPDGHEWVMVDYRGGTGYWATAFQFENGPADLTAPPRTALRWWRELRQASE